MIIVIEGIDGSGKTTLSYRILSYMNKLGKKACVVPSRSFLDFWKADAEELFAGAKQLKSERKMHMLSYSLWHCADFAYRWESEILPSLKASRIVIMDRYVYTQIVRDIVRGLKKEYVSSIYSFVSEPDFIYYLNIDPKIALKRIIKRQNEPGFYESGCDIFPDLKRQESFLKFQHRCQETYKDIFGKKHTIFVDASKNQDSVASNVIKHFSSACGFERI